MRTPPPPGTPYHRLARTDRHRWWRPVLGTVLILGGSFTLLCLFAGVADLAGRLADRPTGPDGLSSWGPLGDLALLLASIAVSLPLVLLAVGWVQARPVGTVSSVLGRLRWRWLGVCALVAVPAVLVLFGGSLGLLALTAGADESGLADGGWPGWWSFLGAVVVLLLLVPLQAAAEEYVCRGWLLQAVGAFFRTPWPAIAVQAVLFAAAHGWGTGWGFAELVFMASLMGWLTVRTGGLEAAVALHVVNNVIAFVGSAALGQLAAEETAADAPWQMLVVSVLVHAAYTGVVLRLARRRRLPTVLPWHPTPADFTPAGPAPADPASASPAPVTSAVATGR